MTDEFARRIGMVKGDFKRRIANMGISERIRFKLPSSRWDMHHFSSFEMMLCAANEIAIVQVEFVDEAIKAAHLYRQTKDLDGLASYLQEVDIKYLQTVEGWRIRSFSIIVTRVF